MPQRHFDSGRIASCGRRLVTHQRQQALQLRTGYPQRLEAVTEATGPPSGRFAMPTDVHWKMLSTNWFRTTYGVVELEEFAMMAHALRLVIPECPKHRQLLVGASPPAFEIGATRLDLFPQPADADTESKPAARQHIDG